LRPRLAGGLTIIIVPLALGSGERLPDGLAAKIMHLRLGGAPGRFRDADLVSRIGRAWGREVSLPR
jgi:hypothetical protein